jgi:hypothetical protein
MVSVANRLAVTASRMVEVIGANGIYSSPIVKTIWIKAWLRKKRVLAWYVSTQKTYSGIGTQRGGGRFLKAEMKKNFLGPSLALGCGRTVFPVAASTEAVALEVRVLRKRFSISDRNRYCFQSICHCSGTPA